MVLKMWSNFGRITNFYIEKSNHLTIVIFLGSLFFFMSGDFDQDSGPLSIQLTDVTRQFSVEMGSRWIILDDFERPFMFLL